MIKTSKNETIVFLIKQRDTLQLITYEFEITEKFLVVISVCLRCNDIKYWL